MRTLRQNIHVHLYVFSAITFIDGDNQTANIGLSKRIECQAENGIGNDGLLITKQGIDAMQLTCLVEGSTNHTCGDTDMVLIGVLFGDVMTATLVIPDVSCSDSGTYECAAVSDLSQKAVMELSLTSSYF